MGYGFDTIIDRRNTGAMKWNIRENELPMWVADMDFQAAPEIREALQKRLDHGIFGYTEIPGEWYDAYTGWWKERHGLDMEKDWLVFCTGVVPAVSSIVRKLVAPGENVLIQTPVYNIFFNSILNNGCRVLESPLRYENGTYGIDWGDLEQKMSDPVTTLMILCNPHNPVGKIWDRETLQRIGELAEKHNVTVLSDEIHCDITAPGKEYVPFLSISETCRKVGIAAISPTKAFNLAGLQTAAVAVPDPALRRKVWRGLNTDEVAEPNAFAVIAAVAAFTQGAAWLDELRKYVFENRKIVSETLRRELPSVTTVDGEATYLLWLDVSKVTEDGDALAASIRETTGLILSRGSAYGETGRAFFRMNLACPRSLLEDGISRLIRGVRLFST